MQEGLAGEKVSLNTRHGQVLWRQQGIRVIKVLSISFAYPMITKAISEDTDNQKNNIANLHNLIRLKAVSGYLQAFFCAYMLMCV